MILLLWLALLAVADIEHVLVIGSPGGGKSMAAARDLILSPDTSAVLLDPHTDSTARLVLEHAEGRPMLFDNLADLNHPLGYGLLQPSTDPDPRVRRRQNMDRAKLFAEVMVLRGGSSMSATPLREEWVMALLLAYLSQSPPKPPEYVPFGFMPGSDRYRELVRDCTVEEARHKLQTLAEFTPRGLRGEIGSASRLVTAIFGSEEFLARCLPGCDVGRFLSTPGAILNVEGGGAPPEVIRLVMCGLNLNVTQWAEKRTVKWPLVEIILDECTNIGTAGDFEQRKAGETRKAMLRWKFMCQWPNFPGGERGFFQNCVRKEIYRISDRTLAHSLAPLIVGSQGSSNETRASRVEAMTDELRHLKPGWRWVVNGVRAWKEYVPLMVSPWPAWPGLREAKLQEKLAWIYSQKEYRGSGETPSSTSPPATPSPPTSTPKFSPAERWKRGAKKPPASS